MQPRRLGPPVLLGLFTVLALLLITSPRGDGRLGEAFEVGAVYEDGAILVEFRDATGLTESASLEVLGLAESFRRTYAGPAFSESVPFPGPPAHGWAAHPVVIDAEHPEFGAVQIKTEARPAGEPPADAIYSRR